MNKTLFAVMFGIIILSYSINIGYAQYYSNETSDYHRLETLPLRIEPNDDSNVFPVPEQTSTNSIGVDIFLIIGAIVAVSAVVIIVKLRKGKHINP